MACPQGIETSNVQFFSAVKKQYKVQTVLWTYATIVMFEKLPSYLWNFFFTF